MKKTIYSLGIVAAFLVLNLSSCKKQDTPAPTTQPEGTTTTPGSYTVTLQPGAEGLDAVVNSNNPTANYGNDVSEAIEAWTQSGANRIQRSLIDFDYSSIPTGATITKATLTLYADTTTNYSAGSVPVGHSQLSGSNAWNLSRVTSAWNEQTVTWNTMPTIDATTTLSLPASTSVSESYTIDLTTFVKAEIANPTAYYGFMMNLVIESPYRAVYFYSSDGKYPTLHPTMVVEYTK